MDDKEPDVQLTMIDGRDALMMVLVRPADDGPGLVVEAHANGLGKKGAADVLEHLARQWRAAASE